MFSIYDLHGQKVKRHDLQVHKHGRWDDSINNMAAQWPSLHAANPPKMPNTTTSNIVESKTVKDRLMLTNFLAANKNSSDGGAGARLMNGSNSNSENAAAAARGDEGKQQRTANNSAISSNDGENRVIACEQGSWCSGKKSDVDVDISNNERIRALEMRLSASECENKQLRLLCSEFEYKTSLSEGQSHSRTTSNAAENDLDNAAVHGKNGIVAIPNETVAGHGRELMMMGMGPFYNASPISPSLLSFGSEKLGATKDNPLEMIASASTDVQPSKIFQALSATHRLSVCYLDLYQRTQKAELFWGVSCSDLRHNFWRFKQLLDELFVLIDMSMIARNGNKPQMLPSLQANSQLLRTMNVVKQLEEAYQLSLFYLDLHFRTHSSQQRWLALKGCPPDISSADNLRHFQLSLNMALNQIEYEIRREKQL